MNEERRKTVGELISGLPGVAVRGDRDLLIEGITDDSRKAGPAHLFVAVRGRTVDGHDFVGQAVERGASAVLVDREVEVPDGVTTISCPNTAQGFAVVAANFFDRPADSLELVAVTGTNGKTTTCYLLESILAAWGKSAGVVGTVSYRYGGKTYAAPYTTPTPMVLHYTLRQMVDAGCDYALLEVSSHALEMDRVYGLEFSVAGFTNLTQDHLDLHGDMESYFAAKQKLFRHHVAAGGTVVGWADDPSARDMIGVFAGRKLFCAAADQSVDVFLESRELTLEGLRGKIHTPSGPVEVASPLLGATNLANILMATTMAIGMGVELDVVARGISGCDVVPGRLERVDTPRDGSAAVLVDYAHTPDAIRQVLDTLRPLCEGRLFVIFGCGGDRDRTKRPIMGAAAGGGADLVVVTSDNPRTEDPRSIIEMAAEGVVESGKSPIKLEDLSVAKSGYVVVDDRREAIRWAIAASRPGDVVLVAGKGHEDYQILGTRRVHFDDREEARKALDRAASTGQEETDRSGGEEKD